MHVYLHITAQRTSIKDLGSEFANRGCHNAWTSYHLTFPLELPFVDLYI